MAGIPLNELISPSLVSEGEVQPETATPKVIFPEGVDIANLVSEPVPGKTTPLDLDFDDDTDGDLDAPGDPDADVAAARQKAIDNVTVGAAGLAQGTLGMSEAIYRTPETGVRYLDAFGEAIGLDKVAKFLVDEVGIPDFAKPTDIITKGFNVFGHKVAGTTDVADSIHATMKKLPEMFRPFKKLHEKGAEADEAFKAALDGRFNKLGKVVTDPQAWAGFVGQAVPSLYMAWKSGGSLPFIMWLEGMEASSNAADFEKRTGVKISDTEFAKSVSLVGVANGLLEKTGLDKIMYGQGSGLRRFFGGSFWEAGTEGTQAFVGNVGAQKDTRLLGVDIPVGYDPDQELSEGVLPGMMGGYGAGGGTAITQGQQEKPTAEPIDIGVLHGNPDIVPETADDIPVPTPEEAAGMTEEEFEQAVEAEAAEAGVTDKPEDDFEYYPEYDKPLSAYGELEQAFYDDVLYPSKLRQLEAARDLDPEGPNADEILDDPNAPEFEDDPRAWVEYVDEHIALTVEPGAAIKDDTEEGAIPEPETTGLPEITVGEKTTAQPVPYLTEGGIKATSKTLGRKIGGAGSKGDRLANGKRSVEVDGLTDVGIEESVAPYNFIFDENGSLTRIMSDGEKIGVPKKDDGSAYTAEELDDLLGLMELEQRDPSTEGAIPEPPVVAPVTGGDRRGEDREEEDRRQDTEKRKLVSEMTREELEVALKTDPMLNIPNRRAFDELDPSPVVAVIDLDNFKKTNDLMGHPAGDEVLQKFSKALIEEGIDAHRVGGDEFAAPANSEAELILAIERAAERLKSATITATTPEGKEFIQTGIDFSWGIGKTLKEADDNEILQKREKQAAIEAGDETGLPTSTIREVTPEGDDLQGIPTPEEVTQNFVVQVNGKDIQVEYNEKDVVGAPADNVHFVFRAPEISQTGFKSHYIHKQAVEDAGGVEQLAQQLATGFVKKAAKKPKLEQPKPKPTETAIPEPPRADKENLADEPYVETPNGTRISAEDVAPEKVEPVAGQHLRDYTLPQQVYLDDTLTDEKIAALSDLEGRTDAFDMIEKQLKVLPFEEDPKVWFDWIDSEIAKSTKERDDLRAKRDAEDKLEEEEETQLPDPLDELFSKIFGYKEADFKKRNLSTLRKMLSTIGTTQAWKKTKAEAIERLTRWRDNEKTDRLPAPPISQYSVELFTGSESFEQYMISPNADLGKEDISSLATISNVLGGSVYKYGNTFDGGKTGTKGFVFQSAEKAADMMEYLTGEPVDIDALAGGKVSVDKVKQLTQNEAKAIVTELKDRKDILEAATGVKVAKFTEKAEPIVVEEIKASVDRASGDQPVIDVLESLLVDGKPNPEYFDEGFYNQLYTDSVNSIEKAKKAEIQKTWAATIKTKEAEALVAASIDPKTEQGGEFLTGFHHALSNKTKSSLPQGGAYLLGYDKARDWLETDEGTLYASGKKQKKMKGTGAQLRRPQDEGTRLIKDLNKIDENALSAEVFKAIDRLTTRATVFKPTPADGATPGTQEYYNHVRSLVSPFKKMFASRYTHAWGKSDNQAIEDYLDNTQDFDEIKDVAEKYIKLVSGLADAIDGAKNVAEAAKAANEKMYIGNDYTAFARDITNEQIIPSYKAYHVKPDYWVVERIARDENDEKTSKRRKVLTRPTFDRVERSGLTDHRKGRNITAEELKSEFGFADVTYGESVTSNQRQDHTNYAYDSFKDIAERLGIKDSDISLGGTLYMSFGALGRGKHAAHYSPRHPHPDGGTVPVINLTNTRGDGSLAHEWHHALDYHLGGGSPLTTSSTRGRFPKEFMYRIKFRINTGKDAVDKVKKDANEMLTTGRYWGGIGPAKKWENAQYTVKSAIDNLENIINGSLDFDNRYTAKLTDYFLDAIKLDKGKSYVRRGPENNWYWQKDVELFARLGEANMYDTLEGENNYLVSDWVKDGLYTEKAGYRGTPYPQSDERSELNKYLDLLYENIEWGESGPKIKKDYKGFPIDHIKADIEELRDFRNSLPKDKKEFEAWKNSKEAEAAAEKEEEDRLKAEELIKQYEEALEEEAPTIDQELDALSDDDLDSLLDDLEAQKEEAEADQLNVEEGAADPRSRSEMLADMVYTHLNETLGLDTMSGQDLFNMADKAFGGTQADGVYTPKDAYDAMEAGVNKHLHNDEVMVYLDNKLDGAKANPNTDDMALVHGFATGLEAIDEQMPTQTKRTVEQQELQQFSTPHSYGFIMNWLAGVREDDVMLEPSAGTGNIAVFAKNAGATVVVNEMSDYRADLLGSTLNIQVSREDAEQINNLLPDIKPSVIVMNPPFSAAGKRLKGQRDTKIGANHVEQALKKLQPGGRLVALVGKGMNDSAPGFKKWWGKIKKEYNVRANISVSGKGYRKFGTTFDNQILIIDKTGPTTKDVKTAEIENIHAIPEILEEIRNDRKYTGEQFTDKSGSKTAVEAGSSKPRPIEPVLPPADELGYGEGTGPDTEEGQGSGAGDARPPTSGGTGGGAAVSTGGGRGGATAGGRTGRPEAGRGSGTATGNPVDENGIDDSGVPGDVRGLGDIASDAAKNGVKGVNEALDGLAELFGGDKIKSFPAGLDPEHYAKAKPHFDAAYKSFKAAGNNIAEFFAFIIKNYPAGIKPYLKHWATELRDSGDLETDGTSASEEKPTPFNVDISPEAAAKAKEVMTDNIYDEYVPAVTLEGAKPHPGKLVESATMATVNSPKTDYKPDLPQETVESGDLSSAQIEAVIMAGTAHSHTLPDGNTKGFMIGDGTGVGKGRTIGGIIMDNMRQGRKKAVWISEKPKLYKEAIKDMVGIGGSKNDIFYLGDVAANANVPVKRDDGIMFTTYTTMGSSAITAPPGTLKIGKHHVGVGDRVKVRPKGMVGDDGRPSPKSAYIEAEVVQLAKKGKDPKKTLVSIISWTGDVDSNWDPGFLPRSKFTDEGKIEKIDTGFDEDVFELTAGMLEEVSQRAPKKEGVDDIEPRTRLEQMKEWLGEDFDGVIAFDESHNMANNQELKTERGKTKPTGAALAGIELQDSFPKAKIVYVSATAATEVSNLGYASRLGLWGKGTPFTDKLDFTNQIESGGVAAMELVAMNMKASGAYLARSLSFEDVTHDMLVHELTAEQINLYDELADSWQIVLANINAALEETGVVGETSRGGKKVQNSQAKTSAMTTFWGAHQRFFSQVMTSMQMPTVIENIHKDQKNGVSSVMQLVNTYAAPQEKAIKKAKDQGLGLEDYDLTPRQMLIAYLEKSFPVKQFEEYLDDNGNVRSRPAKDSEQNDVLNAEAVARRDRLLLKLGAIPFPENALDILMNEFGPDMVSEVTGRSLRIYEKDGKRVEEKLTKANMDADAKAFMDGKKKILVFSDAGGTGTSYHASLAAENQEKRHHYMLQPGWRADKVMQGFGRTHRSNQKQAPHYWLVTTDLKAQRRFMSSVARRLDQLGALTKGSRQTGSQGMFSAEYNLETAHSEAAVEALFKMVEENKVEGLDSNVFRKEMGLMKYDEFGNEATKAPTNVRQFLNRIMSLKVDTMDTVFNAFFKELSDITDAARLDGTLDVGVENVVAERIEKIHEQDVWVDPESGAATKYVQLKLEDRIKYVTFKQMMERTTLTGQPPLFLAKNKKSGRVYAFTKGRPQTTSSGNVIQRYRRIGTAATADNMVPVNKVGEPGGYMFNQKWDEVDVSEAQKLWVEEVKRLPEFRHYERHIITGNIIPVWDKLKGHPRIVRIQTDEGERMIGRVIPEKEVTDTLRNLGASKKAPKLTPAEMVTKVRAGSTLTLDNGWQILSRKVAGGPRIEIRGPEFKHMEEIEDAGGYIELISHQTRYFIPTGDNSAAVMGEVTKYHKVVDIVESAKADELGAGGTLYSTPFEPVIKAVIKAISAGQPIDKALRILMRPVGRVEGGRFEAYKPIKSQHKKLVKAIVSVTDAAIEKSPWLKDMLTRAKHGLIDYYGLSEEYKLLKSEMKSKATGLQMEARDFLLRMEHEQMTEEDAVLFKEMLSPEEGADPISNERWDGLAEEIREAIISMGEEAVAYGLITEEAFQKNKGAYLHRAYVSHEIGTGQGLLNKFLTGKRMKIYGAETKARGMSVKVDIKKLSENAPSDWEGKKRVKGKLDPHLHGSKFRVFDRHEEVEGKNKPQLRERVYWPEDVPFEPDAYSEEDGWTNRGVWEARGAKGDKVTLWRDFTKTERETMGEILDARFLLAKTYSLLSQDLAAGEFYHRIAENPEWATDAEPPDDGNRQTWKEGSDMNYKQVAYLADDTIEWIRVPDTKIAKSAAKKWGHLAGMYVRKEIWKDLAVINEINSPGLWRRALTQWKINKTARSPVVHMNNIMSNLLFMDMADIRWRDLMDGIRSYAARDEHYQNALKHNAFGGTLVSQELANHVLGPIVQKMERRYRKDALAADRSISGNMNFAWKFWNSLFDGIVQADNKMVNAYNAEDELFRMATYLRRIELGDTPQEAATTAREQFLDYDINAPWVVAARNSVLPFIGYAYRAVPVVSQSLYHRPWKAAKYAIIAHALGGLAYAMWPGDDDEEKERAVMREDQRGTTWLGTPRMMRAHTDRYGLPVFVDVRRFMPISDVFDLHQGQVPFIPAPLMMTGPLLLGAEFFLNKSSFTGKQLIDLDVDTWPEITTKYIDYMFKAWMPSNPLIPGSHYYNKITNAIRTENPAEIGQALFSSIGIKAKSLDVQNEINDRFFELGLKMQAIQQEISSIEAKYKNKLIGKFAYKAAIFNEERARDQVLKQIEELKSKI